jgi:hypothetical protein
MLYWISQGDFNSIIQHNAHFNSAPPLFALLINLVTTFGNSEAVLRSIPMLAGVTSIPVFFIFARQFFTLKVSYLVTLLVATSESLISYSQQVREYSLTFLITTLILLFFVKFLRGSGRWNFVGLTVTLSFGILLQYGIAFLVLALNLIIIWFMFRQYGLNSIAKNDQIPKSTFFKWFSIQLILFILAISDYILALSRQLNPQGFGATSESNYLANAYWDGSLPSLVKLLVGNTYDLLQFSFPGASLFVLVCACGFILLILDHRGNVTGPTRRNFILPLFGIPMVLTFVAACFRLYPYHGDRQSFFLTPMIFIVGGYGISYLLTFDTKKVFTVLILGACLWNGLITDLNYLMAPGSEDIRPAVQNLRENILAEDKIYIFNNSRPAVDYYYPPQNIGQRIYSPERGASPEDFINQIDQISADSGRIWLLFSHSVPAEFKFITDRIALVKTIEPVYTNPDDNVYLYLAK